MLTSFRRATKSKIGTVILALFGLAIVASFAIADVSGVSLGGSGLGSSTLVKVGSLEVTDREMDMAMQQRLSQVRQQNPMADYSTIAADFEPLLQGLVDQRTLQAFARKHGFVVSKRLVDAEIANIPGVKGLNGQFSQQAYESFLSRERLTDAQVRDLLEGSIIQRLLLTPAANNTRVPVGMALPYASMLLERRDGEVALVPISAFTAGLNPTDAQLQQYYVANRSRYMVPEQRSIRIARIGPQQVANVAASDAEIAQFYRANQAQFGASDSRVISQALVQDRNVANQIAARAKGGQSFVEAARPAGLSAEDISIGPQTRKEFTELTGEQVAAAAFGAAEGAVVGPIQSEFGWHVVKIDSIRRQGGKTLEQARSEIAAGLTAQKRTNALADLVEKVQEALDGGSNFEEAARAGGLAASSTPLVTPDGKARENSEFRFPAELEPALRSGFELAANDEPVIEQLTEDSFAMVAPARIVPAAAAPLASIRDQVRADWITKQATDRARTAATSIASKSGGAAPLPAALQQVKAELPPVRRVTARRIDLSNMGDKVPEALRMIFAQGQGKSRVGADTDGRGFFVVKVTRIVPGNALSQPALISEVQKGFQEPLSQEYAQQLLGAARKALNVRRNEDLIAATRKRLLGGS
ncbi:MAG: SurA N-terminal domain-containing protein [Pseudomonadota bacterium]|nr:SurA N-terminal domain-containing protein [Pseudomonadota bacterium]